MTSEYKVVIRDERPKVIISDVGIQGPQGPAGVGTQGPVGPQGPAGTTPVIPSNAGLFKGPWIQTGYFDFAYTPSDVVMDKGTVDAQGRFVPDANGDLRAHIRVPYHTLAETDYYFEAEGTAPLDKLKISGSDQYGASMVFAPVGRLTQNTAQTRWFADFDYQITNLTYPYLTLVQTGSNTTVFNLYGYAYIEDYDKGHVVTHNNSLWESTKNYNSSTPGTNADWTLIVEGESGGSAAPQDTGYRNVTTLASGYDSGHIMNGALWVRRIGNMVTFTGTYAFGGPNNSTWTLPLGDGFSSDVAVSVWGREVTQDPVKVILNGSTASITQYGGGVTAAFTLTYLTDDAWPTTLPGTAV